MQTVIIRRARQVQFHTRRARRSLIAFVARRRDLYYLARGLVVAVILSGALLIALGMVAALAQFRGELSLLASEEQPAAAGLLAAGRPATATQPVAAVQATVAAGDVPAAPTAAEAVAGVGFVPMEVALDHAEARAPALPELPVEVAPAVEAEGQPAEPAAPVVAEQAEQSLPPAPAQIAAPTDVPRQMPPPAAPDRIVVPGIALDAPVVLAPIYTITVREQVFEQWRAPDAFAAGWQEGSAPAGAPGNTVITGHHNVYGEVFRRLHELSPGDEVLLYAGDSAYPYIVAQVMIFEERGVPLEQRQENASWILGSDDTRLTLVTCWPPDSNTHRLIVVAAPNP